MTHRDVDYTTVPEAERKNKALEDIIDWISYPEYERLTAVLTMGVYSGEIKSKEYAVNCIGLFLGIEGYPAWVWIDKIAPDLPESLDQSVAVTPDPK